MNPQFVASKWAEAASLVEAIPAPERLAAQSAVMTALLVGGKPAAVETTKEASNNRVAGKITSIRQLSRYSSKKEVSGPEVVTLLAWFLQENESRGVTAKDCREHWAKLSVGTFATTFLHRAEAKRWLNSAKTGGEPVWELTGPGEEIALKLLVDKVDVATAAAGV